MKASVYIANSRVEIQDTKIPSLGTDDLLLKVRACGVCGTDVRKVVHNLIPSPAILGHEVAGEVVEKGKRVSKFAIGDRVVVAHHTPCYACHYCKHENYSMCKKFKKTNLDPGGFAEFVRIPKDHVQLTAHKIPKEMTFEKAIFMEPLACVLRNIKRIKPLKGDTAWIVGLGSMGLLTSQVLRNQGVKVIATDLQENRLALGRQLGIEAVLDGKDPALGSKIESISQGRGADVVVLTAGNAVLYGTAMRHLRDGGILNIFAGLPPGSKIEFDADQLYSRELKVVASYSPSPKELQEALSMLENDTIDVDVLSPRGYGLDGLGRAIEAIVGQKILKAIIQPEDAAS